MARVTSLLFVVPVKDLDQASTFYRKAFELEEVYRNEGVVFVGIPGTQSSFGLVLDPEHAGDGPQSVGLHVDHGYDRAQALRDVEAAGGRILETGEHAPEVPFARIADPDGNVLEI